jgi:hypothetical protein
VRQVVLGHHLERLLIDLPQLDCLVVGREQVVRGILALAPLDLVDLLLDLQRLEVVEFRLMRLEFGVKLVFAGLLLPTRDMSSAAGRRVGYWRTYTLVALEEDDAAALVARGEVVARLVELYRGDDIRGSNFSDVLDIALVAEAPGLASAGP